MNKQQLHELPLPLQIECACGCGRKIKPKYRWHFYFETKCRVRAWIKRQIKESEEAKLSEHEKRIEKLEEQSGIKQ